MGIGRTTVNRVDLPWAGEGVAVIESVSERKGTMRWQPQAVEETLREGSSAYAANTEWQYTAKVSGSILRKDGTVGLNRMSVEFTAPDRGWRAYGGVEDIPVDIAAFLVGIDGLREWKLVAP